MPASSVRPNLRALGLILLSLSLLLGPTASAHEIQINVKGKGNSTHTISSEIGESFFTLFRGSSARLGDEVRYQLGQVDTNGFRLRDLHGVNVEPDLFFALEGSSNSAFALSVSGFSLDARAVFRCPYSGCHRVNVYLELDEVEAFGTFDYFSGAATLSLVPPDPTIELDPVLNLISSIFLGWLYNVGAGLVENAAEGAIRDALDVVSLDGQLVGLTEVLDSLPSSVISQLGVDPLTLLQNPFVGLNLDISLIAADSFSVPGKIVMSIYHRKPANSSGNVVSSLGNNKKPRVSWSAVPGATQYKVYKQIGWGGNWILRGTTTSTSWSDGTVNHPNLSVGNQGGEIFNYRVVAVNSFGIESSPGPQVLFSFPASSDCLPGQICECDGPGGMIDGPDHPCLY